MYSIVLALCLKFAIGYTLKSHAGQWCKVNLRVVRGNVTGTMDSTCYQRNIPGKQRPAHLKTWDHMHISSPSTQTAHKKIWYIIFKCILCTFAQITTCSSWRRLDSQSLGPGFHPLAWSCKGKQLASHLSNYSSRQENIAQKISKSYNLPAANSCSEMLIVASAHWTRPSSR